MNKKEQLKQTLNKNKEVIGKLYSRKNSVIKDKDLNPVDDVLDADFVPEASPKKIPVTRTGIMNKNINKNNNLDKNKNNRKLKNFLDKVRSKRKS